MASVSVTNTFTNSTTADATQVNTNFTDIINGTSDGTKDFSISALTTAGTATLNGAVTLGNGTSKDISVLGSLATSLPVKTTFSYDLGTSTIGWRKIYFGSADSAARTTNVLAGTVATSNTVTFPINTGTLPLVAEVTGSKELSNVTLTASVAASALTVALKAGDGNDCSASNVAYATFRSATAATGTFTRRSISGALSVVVSSGSTLGHASAVSQYIYVYLIDNAGTVELAVSSALFDEGARQSTTAEGGAGAATSNRVMYSTSARTNVGVRLIGRLISTQATAGTWATTPSELSLPPFELKSAPFASYGRGTNQSMTNGGVTLVDFATKVTDTRNAVTTGGSWKFTAPEAGIYAISCAVLFDTSTTWAVSEAGDFNIYKNGASHLVLDRQDNDSATGHFKHLGGSATIALSVADYIDIRVGNYSGGNLNTYADQTQVWITIAKVGSF